MSLLEDLRERRDRLKKIIFPSEKDECLRMIQEILKEYDYKESDIPVVHHYWELKNFYGSIK